MHRFTHKQDSLYHLESDEVQAAIEQLARYENFHEQLLQDQIDAERELAELRGQNKQKTVKFRELLTNRMIESNILAMLKRHGIQ
ncbi:hypothetical protein LJC33_02870 [Eubacteriales bacterium OttesenSCG-928-N13]|nr:hypothetical protein [Eubacteriales bacterium OttesenSCG-928-N13]